jgi:predicted DNA-binding protein YlxM (UPF0122 family)
MNCNANFFAAYFYRKDFPDYLSTENNYYYKNDDSSVVAHVHFYSSWVEVKIHWLEDDVIKNASTNTIIKNKCKYDGKIFSFDKEITERQYYTILEQWTSILTEREEQKNQELVANVLSMEIIPKTSPRELFEQFVYNLIKKDSSSFKLINDKLLIWSSYNNDIRIYEQFGKFYYQFNGEDWRPYDNQFKEYTIDVAKSFLEKHTNEDKFFDKMRELLNEG